MQKIAKKVFIVLLILLMVVSVVSIFTLTSPTAQAAGGIVWHETQQTTSNYNKYDPQLQVEGSTIYYVWQEEDSSGIWQIWTATSDLDGSNFIATKRTNHSGSAEFPQQIVDGTKIYYMYWVDQSASAGRYDIYTAEMNTNGTGFTETRRTNATEANTFVAESGRMAISGSKLFFVWIDFTPSNYGLYTAEMNTDGSGWSAIRRVADVCEDPDFLVLGTKLYLVYRHALSAEHIGIASMDTDGTNWTTEDKESSSKYKSSFRISTDGTHLYYAWSEQINDSPRVFQLKFAYSDLDGTNWQSRILGETETDYMFFIEMEYYNNQIYINWADKQQVSFSGTIDLDDDEFRPTQRTDDADWSWVPKMDIQDPLIYYVYEKIDGSGKYQIHTAYSDNTDTAQETQTVTATVPSSLTFTIDGVVAGNPCANSGGNADITTTGTTIPFGIYTGSQSKIGCQTLTVSTNATNGYIVTVEQDDVLTSANSDTLSPFSGTHATPTTWASPPGSGTNSYFGYTTDDTGLSNFQTAKYGNFLANDTPYQIVYESGPVSNEANVISYQLEVNTLQEAGTYTNTIMYIATATF